MWHYNIEEKQAELQSDSVALKNALTLSNLRWK